jgi:hypothetical protein
MGFNNLVEQLMVKLSRIPIGDIHAIQAFYRFFATISAREVAKMIIFTRLVRAHDQNGSVYLFQPRSYLDVSFKASITLTDGFQVLIFKGKHIN